MLACLHAMLCKISKLQGLLSSEKSLYHHSQPAVCKYERQAFQVLDALYPYFRDLQVYIDAFIPASFLFSLIAIGGFKSRGRACSLRSFHAFDSCEIKALQFLDCLKKNQHHTKLENPHHRPSLGTGILKWHGCRFTIATCHSIFHALVHLMQYLRSYRSKSGQE